MSDIVIKILESPATNYILSFGGLGTLLMLALNWSHRYFKLAERTWGLTTLAAGACGGLLLHLAGFVVVPGGFVIGAIFAMFIGAAVAAAACGFSAVDLRRTISKAKENE